MKALLKSRAGSYGNVTTLFIANNITDKNFNERQQRCKDLTERAITALNSTTSPDDFHRAQ